MKRNTTAWLHRDELKLSEAVLLMLGHDPNLWSEEKLLNAPPSDFKAIYGLMLQDAVTVLEELVESQEFQGEYYTEYRLTTDKDDKLKKLTDKDGLTITASISDIERWIKYRNLPYELFAEDADDNHLSSKREHYSNKLVTLNQAADRFWMYAERSDRDTHPLNRDIESWLVKRGFSSSLAKSAATIVRPDWAPVGRKPEE